MAGAKRSAKYLFVGGLFSKAVSFIGTIILARILFPEDFGYLLSAMIIAGFIQMFGNVGFENFYLQEKTNSKEEEEKILHITYKLRLFVNLILFALQWAVSYIAESYYSPVVGEMLRIFSFNILLMIPAQINMYILRKKLDYRPEVYANVSRDIVATITKVLFAWSGFGALSFALGAVLGNVVRTSVLLKYQSFKPNFSIKDRKIFEKIFFFGKHSFIGGIGMYLSTQVDKILLINTFSQQISGYYYFANSQASTFINYVLQPQSSLLISYASKYKREKYELFKKLSNIGYLIALLIVPTYLYLFFYSDIIFNILFNEKWISSVLYFKIFLIYYIFVGVAFPFSGLLTSLGLPHIGSKLTILRFIVLSLVLGIISLFNNIVYYIISFVTVDIIFIWIKVTIALNKINISVFDYIITLFYMTIGLVFITVLSIYIINNLFDNGYEQMLYSFLCIAFFVIVSQVTIYKKIFFDVFSIIKSR